jgi:ribosomal protein S1
MNAKYSVGERISAIVDHCEPYGVYLSSAGLKILVLIPDVSWTPIRDLKEVYKPGDIVDIILLSNIESQGYWRGSINATHPDDDPRVHLARMPQGTVFVATVKDKFKDCPLTVQIENHLYGELPESSQTQDLRQGDEVKVCVESIDFENKWVHFRLA